MTSLLPIDENTTSETQLYDAFCRALEAAVAVDEVMAIHDKAAQLAACARIANNHKAEADAVVLRMRATHRLGQLMQAQKDSVGFNRGAAGGGKKDGPRGSVVNSHNLRPTLASQGISKSRAYEARRYSALSDKQFETVADEAIHNKVRLCRARDARLPSMMPALVTPWVSAVLGEKIQLNQKTRHCHG
jgi:hypothetical protein